MPALHPASFRLSRCLRAISRPVLLAAALATAGQAMFAVRAEAANLNARSAILIDFANGEALYEKNPDMPIQPASLTKMMTLHLAYKALDAGTIHRDDYVTITREMCAMPPGSSLMPLAVGERVTVKQLMLGMAVVSGNDSAYALAIYIAGSVKAFAAMMNAEAASMGYKVMHFVEPSGISEKNMVTAREYADFCRRYLIMHPESIDELHSVRQLDFPLPVNLPLDKSGQVRTLHQLNRNMLLWDYEGCDGLKTGYIVESGYNIALTAKRGDTRLIAVTLGGTGHGYYGGYATRARDGQILLDYGFANYVTVKPEITRMTPVRVWKGTLDEIVPVPGESLDYTLERNKADSLTVRVEKSPSVIAPIRQGEKLGSLVYSVGGVDVRTVPLVAQFPVGQAGFFKRLWHSVLMIFQS